MHSSSLAPLVTIGIPTFNRATTLQRSLNSALSQTHHRLEVLVFDDASSDDTEAICREYAARDSRVRYVRHARRLGLTANFNAIYAACTGEFAMMLSDDDWLDARYVEGCLSHLQARRDHVLVGGVARYYRDSEYVGSGVEMNLPQARGARRVLAYYRGVTDNGSTYYGLMRTTALRAALPMPNVIGNDWMLVAAVAFQGKVLTIRDVLVDRDHGGTSADVVKIVRTLGGDQWQKTIRHERPAMAVAREIALKAPVFRTLPVPERLLVLAVRCANAAMDWPAQVWYVSHPLIASLEAHGLARSATRSYRRTPAATASPTTQRGPRSHR